MKQPILERIRTKRTYFEGGCGTVLQSMGLPTGVSPEVWNLEHPERVLSLHTSYIAAGCNILKTNTFGANRLKCDIWQEAIRAAVGIAQKAAEGHDDVYIALDVGPTGRMLQPYGDLGFEDAVAAFADTIHIGVEAGAELILIETMNDAYETKAAVLAAHEVTDLPVFVTNVYDESGKLMTGANPAAMAALLEGLRVDAVGLNCSLGPKKMLTWAKELYHLLSVPLIAVPNAGLPSVVDGKTTYTLGEEEYSDTMVEMAQYAHVLGGCCGTTPAYLSRTIEKTKEISLPRLTEKKRTVISSYTHAVEFGKFPVLIGERINPTGKQKLKAALREGNMEYILGEGIRQADAGAHVLDVNVGLPEIDEPKTMEKVIRALQEVTDLPLQTDSADPAALECAMRIYNGKPLVNSVSGKEVVMKAVFPLVRKYGGVLIALTLDESGIPKTAEGRVAIAHRIISCAKEYGIRQNDIIIDPLCMAVSSEPDCAVEVLRSVRMLHAEGIATSLGVSNISFGLPHREIVNEVFFAQALDAGLSAAICNPFAHGMLDAYYAHCALHCMDASCARYIAYAQEIPADIVPTGNAVTVPVPLSDRKPMSDVTSDLYAAVLHGSAASAERLAREALSGGGDAITVINEKVLPALNAVGEGFEKKKLFLPQLLAAAEAAAGAFSVLKEGIRKSDSKDGSRGVVLATVYGDIHDIGKNIVHVMLESYGFTVYDLGKNVPPEDVLRAAREHDCHFIGLSALMTTTVPAMEETITLLHREMPRCCVLVGGAVLTQDYASKIGADMYAPDAMATVHCAQKYYEEVLAKA